MVRFGFPLPPSAGSGSAASARRPKTPTADINNVVNPRRFMACPLLMLVYKYSCQPRSSISLTSLRIASSSCLLATSVASGVCTTMQSVSPSVTTR